MPIPNKKRGIPKTANSTQSTFLTTFSNTPLLSSQINLIRLKIYSKKVTKGISFSNGHFIKNE